MLLFSDSVRWPQLQVCLQLLVAFQAEHPVRWLEEEGQPLRRRYVGTFFYFFASTSYDVTHLTPLVKANDATYP